MLNSELVLSNQVKSSNSELNELNNVDTIEFRNINASNLLFWKFFEDYEADVKELELLLSKVKSKISKCEYLYYKSKIAMYEGNTESYLNLLNKSSECGYLDSGLDLFHKVYFLDSAQALTGLLRSANLGNADAQFIAGNYFFYGNYKSSKIDKQKGLAFYKLSGKQGYYKAIEKLSSKEVESLITKDESFFWKFMFSLYSRKQDFYSEIFNTISSDEFNFNGFCESINQVSNSGDHVDIAINKRSFKLLEIILKCQN